MIRLHKLESCKEDKLAEALVFINETRKNYPYSSHTYTDTNIENVYLIISNKKTVGFCEAAIRNAKLEFPKKVDLYLGQIHIAESEKRKGIGEATIRHLIKLGLPIELTVANVNTPMLKLIETFKAEVKYEPEHVKTYIIKANSD